MICLLNIFVRLWPYFQKQEKADEPFYAVEWFLPVVPIFRTAFLFLTKEVVAYFNLLLYFSSGNCKNEKKTRFEENFFLKELLKNENRKTDYSFSNVESGQSDEKLSVWHVMGAVYTTFNDIASKIVLHMTLLVATACFTFLNYKKLLT